MTDYSKKQSSTPNVHARVQDLLADARAASESGDWHLAQSLVNAVLALEPANAQAKAMFQGPAVRRQMTMLFCDIVGSTKMADERDPEEVSILLRAYRTVCHEIVDRFGGFIDDHRGDGMLVLFGYPQVNEDDARRAVQCGRAIVSTLNRRMQTLLNIDGEVTLQVRIAVHTDLVVLDGVGVAGSTANETARIQDHAPVNTVVISDATNALVRTLFETTSIGIVRLRGVSRPVEIFSVVRERSAQERTLPTSPFVGRQRELIQLQEFLLARVPMLIVSGQAGVGKTRLVTEASRRFGIHTVECRSSRMDQNTSLRVFRQLIEQSCGIEEAEEPGDRLAKLRSRVGDSMRQHGDLPFLSTAIGVPLRLLGAPVDVNPSQLREFALRAAADLIKGFLGETPTTVFVDDVHWADQSSIDLITRLVADESTTINLVLTARDGFESPWPTSLVRRVVLEPLGRGDLTELADLLPEGSALPAEDLAELIERSDGIPLFLEELLRTADAIGRGSIVHRSIRFGEYRIPPALLDPLLARLATPQVDLEMAQVAATIGRNVDRGLLQRVMNLNLEEFRGRVATLLAAGLVEESGDGLRFRHELIREVAYESQRRSTTRRNHSAVADEIGVGSHDTAPAKVSERASHLERAGRYTEAIAAHLQVAAADQSVGAHTEVTNRLTHTLDLIPELPDESSRLHTELAVRGMRSFSAVTSRGYGASEAALDYQRSAELCQKLVGAPESVPALINSWSYYASRGELRQADAVVEALVREREAAGLPIPVREVCRGINEFIRGHFDVSRQLLEDFMHSGWGETPEHPPQIWQLPSDPLAAVGANQAFTLWVQGEPEAAEECWRRAYRRTDNLVFPFGPFTACYIDHHVAMVRAVAGDYVGVANVGAHMRKLSDRHGFALWQLTAALHLEFGAVMLGQGELVGQFAEHVSLARTVLATDSFTPYWLTQLGVAQHAIGKSDDALLSLSQALEVADHMECAFFSAETLRIQGRLRAELGEPSGTADIQKAIELAAEQCAPVLEERARSTFAELAKA